MPFDGTGFLREVAVQAPAVPMPAFRTATPAMSAAATLVQARRHYVWTEQLDAQTSVVEHRPMWSRDVERPAQVVTLVGLSALLRDPLRWPQGFTWNYGRSDRCAMGLCDAAYGDGAVHRLMSGLESSRDQLQRIFWNNGNRGHLRPFSWTTPAMVADDIDALMAGTFRRGTWRRFLPF